MGGQVPEELRTSLNNFIERWGAGRGRHEVAIDGSVDRMSWLTGCFEVTRQVIESSQGEETSKPHKVITSCGAIGIGSFSVRRRRNTYSKKS
jgi:hypothetical protein